MKKEYITLTLLIIGLSLYLGLKKENRVNYDLPVIPRVDTARIDRVEIARADRQVVLTKGDSGWTVTDKKFAVNSNAVTQMLATLKQIKLSALVSEAKDLSRYELDDAHAVKVTALAGKETMRRIVIGKTAPSYNHTFICLGDKEQVVYQANGNFRAQFDKGVTGFRDKQVLAFNPEHVKKITLERQGKVVTLVKSRIPETAGPKADPKKDDTQKDLAAEKSIPEKTAWKNESGDDADLTSVSNLLSDLARLECQTFLDDEKAALLTQASPACKILIETDNPLILNIFSKDDNSPEAESAGVQSSCSYTPYAFTLASSTARNIASYTDALMGIEPPPQQEINQ